jgi:predicted metal-dependent peptidase
MGALEARLRQAAAMAKKTLRDGDWFTPELQKSHAADMATSPIRQLTDEERAIYGGATIAAARMVPVFRDSIAILNPFMDATCETAYVDRYARIGVGYWFLHGITNVQRASVVLHETLHILNNHFARGDMMSLSSEVLGIAGDLEINTTLEQEVSFDLEMALYPDRAPFNFPAGKGMEQYAKLIQDRGQAGAPPLPTPPSPIPEDGASQDKQEGAGEPPAKVEEEAASSPEDEATAGASGEPGEGAQGEAPGEANPGEAKASGEGEASGEGQGESKPGSAASGGSSDGAPPQVDGDWSCGEATEKRSEAADQAGVEKASVSEQTIAKTNTQARIVDSLNSGGRGSGIGNSTMKVVLERMQPPQVRWQDMLRRLLAQANDRITRGRSDYSYRRVSRRHSGSEYIFPGMIQYEPSIAFGVDTSGSMGKDDYTSLLAEVEELIKLTSRGKTAFSVFSVDTTVSKIKPSKSVKDLALRGGGGTDMSVAFRYINELPRREQVDLFILATDGGTDWKAVLKELENAKRMKKNYQSLILITQKSALKGIPERVKRLAKVVDISRARAW